jgi:hypothetical protein
MIKRCSSARTGTLPSYPTVDRLELVTDLNRRVLIATRLAPNEVDPKLVKAKKMLERKNRRTAIESLTNTEESSEMLDDRGTKSLLVITGDHRDLRIRANGSILAKDYVSLIERLLHRCRMLRCSLEPRYLIEVAKISEDDYLVRLFAREPSENLLA